MTEQAILFDVIKKATNFSVVEHDGEVTNTVLSDLEIGDSRIRWDDQSSHMLLMMQRDRVHRTLSRLDIVAMGRMTHFLYRGQDPVSDDDIYEIFLGGSTPDEDANIIREINNASQDHEIRRWVCECAMRGLYQDTSPMIKKGYDPEILNDIMIALWRDKYQTNKTYMSCIFNRLLRSQHDSIHIDVSGITERLSPCFDSPDKAFVWFYNFANEIYNWLMRWAGYDPSSAMYQVDYMYLGDEDEN